MFSIAQSHPHRKLRPTSPVAVAVAVHVAVHDNDNVNVNVNVYEFPDSL